MEQVYFHPQQPKLLDKCLTQSLNALDMRQEGTPTPDAREATEVQATMPQLIPEG